MVFFLAYLTVANLSVWSQYLGNFFFFCWITGGHTNHLSLSEIYLQSSDSEKFALLINHSNTCPVETKNIININKIIDQSIPKTQMTSMTKNMFKERNKNKKAIS